MLTSNQRCSWKDMGDRGNKVLQIGKEKNVSNTQPLGYENPHHILFLLPPFCSITLPNWLHPKENHQQTIISSFLGSYINPLSKFMLQIELFLLRWCLQVLALGVQWICVSASFLIFRFAFVSHRFFLWHVHSLSTAQSATNTLCWDWCSCVSMCQTLLNSIRGYF